MQPIRFGDEGQIATAEALALLDKAAPRWGEFCPAERLETLRRQFKTLQAIDRQYGGQGALALEDAAELVAAILSDLASIETQARRASDEASLEAVSRLVIAVALWAIRHEVEITVVEPVTNALAERSNQARTRAQLSAVFSLMQGVIAHISPRLSADLERSNPERPWRLLHLNFAITAIRTEDPALAQFAFDALDAALPDERAGFYAEALALALSPRVAAEMREKIELRHRKWTLHQ
jgi:hypothetical protein